MASSASECFVDPPVSLIAAPVAVFSANSVAASVAAAVTTMPPPALQKPKNSAPKPLEQGSLGMMKAEEKAVSYFVFRSDLNLGRSCSDLAGAVFSTTESTLCPFVLGGSLSFAQFSAQLLASWLCDVGNSNPVLLKTNSGHAEDALAKLAVVQWKLLLHGNLRAPQCRSCPFDASPHFYSTSDHIPHVLAWFLQLWARAFVFVDYALAKPAGMQWKPLLRGNLWVPHCAEVANLIQAHNLLHF